MNIFKYIRKISKELSDEHNLFNELMLAWIAGMLTLLVVFTILNYI